MPNIESAALATELEAPGERKTVTVAFVNNMPDAAIRSSERQFRRLLPNGAGDVHVAVKGFYWPEPARMGAARRELLQPYRNIEELWDSEIDGLIVTGAEPQAARLQEEPYWPILSRLADWAKEHTISAIWSCLAAHAAAYRLSGIERQPFAKKLSGLCQCVKCLDHPLTEGMPQGWLVPHSRTNDLPEGDLLAHGYKPLSRLDNGFDTFIKEGESLFVFFQGHPEYDPDSLLLEYIRDVKRFAEGARDTFPDPPGGYFDRAALETIALMQARAASDKKAIDLRYVSGLLHAHPVENVWRGPASILYRNWVNYLAGTKFAAEGAALAGLANKDALAHSADGRP